MCTLRGKCRCEADELLSRATGLIRLAARTNYLHQTRERGVEPYTAITETDAATDRLLDQLRMSARDEIRSSYRHRQRGTQPEMTCPRCGGFGSNPAYRHLTQGGAPHSGHSACEGWREVPA